MPLKNEVKIEIVQINSEHGVESREVVESKVEFMHRAEDWFESHGTNVNDFDEFHAHFMRDEDDD